MAIEVIPEIVSEYAEDAAFKWHGRNRAVHAPDRSLEDLVELDDQIDACLGGLRIAGDEGWKLCQAALERGAGGEYFVATVLALEAGSEEQLQTVIEGGGADPELRAGLVSAFGWLPFQTVGSHIRRLMASASPASRRIGIAAAAIHRQDPGNVLKDALGDPDPGVRTRALRAVGELGRRDLQDALWEGRRAEEPACRFWAAWSAALLSETSAVEVLRSFAKPGSPFRRKALEIAMRVLDSRAALNWQRELGDSPETVRLAILGAGIHGDPERVPWLLDHLSTPDLARVAFEAIVLITGANPSEGLKGQEPEAFEAGPNDDPEDDNVAMDPDGDLPWPNLEALRSWWDQQGARFPAGIRHFLGKPMSADLLLDTLRTGAQTHRAAAALERSLANPGTPFFEVRAPGFRQTRILSQPLPYAVSPNLQEDWKVAMMRGIEAERREAEQKKG